MADRLAIFAKAPVAGRVKTRLTPPFTAEEAAALYEACLHDVIETARAGAAEVVLFHGGGPGAADYFAERFPGLAVERQSVGDLGDRMEDAFDRLFTGGAERCAIVGTDSPTLPARILASLWVRLANHDVVLGPTTDGGYYLVGLTARAWPSARALFRGIPWSTPQVLDHTVAAAAGCGLALAELERWYDIDHPEDVARAAGDADPGSRLATLLRDRPALLGRS